MQQECYPISYYTNKNFTIPSNFTLIFPKGDHILTDSLLMKGLQNVTLKGQGQWVHGFHWSVMQSNVSNVKLTVQAIAWFSGEAICIGIYLAQTVDHSKLERL